MGEVAAALLIALSLSLSNSAPIQTNTAYIFLGDSRTVGMNNAIDIDSTDNLFVVAKVGEGYKWMIDTGLSEVSDIIADHTEYNKWVLVTNLGVNDLHNTSKYEDTYKELAELMQVYVVSVNPCDGSYDKLNTDIDSFNNTMRDLDCVTFIDTCEYLRNSGFKTSDGLHYTKDTYKKIYEMVSSVVLEE